MVKIRNLEKIWNKYGKINKFIRKKYGINKENIRHL